MDRTFRSGWRAIGRVAGLSALVMILAACGSSGGSNTSSPSPSAGPGVGDSLVLGSGRLVVSSATTQEEFDTMGPTVKASPTDVFVVLGIDWSSATSSPAPPLGHENLALVGGDGSEHTKAYGRTTAKQQLFLAYEVPKEAVAGVKLRVTFEGQSRTVDLGLGQISASSTT